MNLKNGFFVTGTDTDIGKTIVSAVLVNKFKANYWKPIQCGENKNNLSDSAVVKKLTIGSSRKIFKESYYFSESISPNLAAKRNKIKISIEIMMNDFKNFEKPVIVEGAGGVLVPINNKEFMIDLINAIKLPIILVTKTSLGTINHTLLTINVLNTQNQIIYGIVFVGDEDPEVEKTILRFSRKIKKNIKNLGRIPIIKKINRINIDKLERFLNF
tara:strand:+ start:68 stop:712 length:645 start_codon:yes stop_codon:yes gene_type:complete